MQAALDAGPAGAITKDSFEGVVHLVAEGGAAAEASQQVECWCDVGDVLLVVVSGIGDAVDVPWCLVVLLAG